MYKVFIDTCSYIRIGLNFDPNTNSIINSLISYSKKEIKIIMISVIKKELISHLNDDRKKEIDNIETNLRKIRWLSNYITPDIVNENVNKRLDYFYNFLSVANVEEISVDDINPEYVFNKYFDHTLPFEDNDKKKYEFPDAFIVEKIKKYINVNNKDNKYIVITADEGMKNSLSDIKKIKFFSEIKEMLTLLSNIDEATRKSIEVFLEEENYEKVTDKILETANIIYDEEEYIEFDIDYLQIESMHSIDIIDYNEEINEYTICTNFRFKLCGNYIKRNLDVSVWDSESNEYSYEEFDNICSISLPSVYVEFKIKKADDVFVFNGINYCEDLDINEAISYEIIEKNVSPNRLDNLIAEWK